MQIQELRRAVKQAAQKLFAASIEPELSRPDEKFGDYASNVALQLAKKAAATPQQIAQKLKTELQNLDGIKDIGIAGPGFLNFRLTDEAMQSAAQTAAHLDQPLAGQEILVEFGDANPFKDMHIGHLYSSVVGDAMASLLKAQGATVRRLSYHGDVGLHVAKAIWGMQQPDANADEIGSCYAAGAQAYENDEAVKAEIDDINEHIYKHDDAEINKLYDAGRAISLENFHQIYHQLNLKYDKHYFESEAMPIGLKFVQDHQAVFKKSHGAIVFEGEKAGLHTRVFITSKGLPTYETKDLGLAELKNQDHPQATRSIIITANEQSEYFKVMLAALAEIDQGLASKTTHLSHGFVNLSTGKMSSRTGDIYAAENLINEVNQATKKQFPDSDLKPVISIAALKYDFLKSRLGADITFDVQTSVSLEGNSGPYLQYAHARAASILAKAGNKPAEGQASLDQNERSLALKISEYPEVIEKAANELMPHHICTYLYELAQTFNSFYEKSRIIGDEREAIRLSLTRAYKDVLQKGLAVLNIDSPEKM